MKGLAYVRANALGVTGFCFGGGMTWELAVASADLKAAVPYYGTASGVLDRLVQLQRQTLQAVVRGQVHRLHAGRLQTLVGGHSQQAAVLVVYGGSDTRITGERPQVEERLRAAGKTYEIKVYDGAGHAFFNDTGASYNATAAADAWQSTLAWFRRHLPA